MNEAPRAGGGPLLIAAIGHALPGTGGVFQGLAPLIDALCTDCGIAHESKSHITGK